MLNLKGKAMCPFVDGDQKISKLFLVATDITLLTLTEEERANNEADYREHEIKILELVSAHDERDLELKVQQLCVAELAKVNFRFEVVHFNERWCREVLQSELEVVVSAARTVDDIAPAHSGNVVEKF